MVEFGNHFWGNPTFSPEKTPYREWMSINYSQGRLGCHYCPTFLGVKPHEFGTHPGTKNSIRKLGFMFDNI